MLSLPRPLGRYALLVPIGSGGMGTVYLSRMRGIGGFSRDVAVKCLHSHLQNDDALVQSFLREARVAANIRHPHVVPVIDVDRTPEGVFLVMDYVPGASLAELRKLAAEQRQSLPPAVAMPILADALSGLHAAHELRDEAGRSLGIVHRDFSPHNILAGTDGRGRLVDFGVAKVARSSLRTESGVIKGKLPYMSPEQVQGAELDRRSDVWAAGVVAWELLAGRRMHRDSHETKVLMAIANQEAPSLAEACPGLPPRLVAVVGGALVRDPGARCPDAETFRGNLIGACREAGLWSDHAEVVAYVEACVGASLRVLQTKVSEATRLMGEPPAAAGPAWATPEPVTTPDLDARSTAKAESPANARIGTEATLPQATVPSQANIPSARQPSRTRSRAGRARVWLFAGLAVGALAAGLVFRSGRAPAGRGDAVVTRPAVTPVAKEPRVETARVDAKVKPAPPAPEPPGAAAPAANPERRRRKPAARGEPPPRDAREAEAIPKKPPLLDNPY
jgi:serine/threonine-protein kinase